MRSKSSVLALPVLLGSLSFAHADATMTGKVSVPKTISGITSSLACHDFSIGAFEVPSCPAGQLCPSLGKEIKSVDLSGTYSTGKCSYSLDVPGNKKFLISIQQTSHMPKCANASSGWFLSVSVKGPNPFDVSGLPSGVTITADYEAAASCQKPPP
jgi:hypothetical protein